MRERGSGQQPDCAREILYPYRVYHRPLNEANGTMTFDHASLKARAHRIKAKGADGLGLRVHRALSWLAAAERAVDDDDARFIFLWISLNAAYADEIQRESSPEQAILDRFLRRLVDLDPDNLLYDLVWSRFAGPFRVLLDNRFVFQPFWDYQNGKIDEDRWRRSFEGAKTAARRALADTRQTATVLAIVLARLYTLRNQLMHGGATWHSSVNRDQIRDGTAILADLVPRVIHLLIVNRQEDWGAPCYPVVRDDD